MDKTSIIPDSTFFLCFIDDINDNQDLIKILNADRFHFLMGPVVYSEISKSKNYESISETIKNSTSTFPYYDYGAIIKPFFSLDEIKRGENEVIVISYIVNLLGSSLIFIIDDGSPRNFIKRILPDLYKYLYYSIKFLEYCTVECKLLSKDDAIRVLTAIKASKFRVPKIVIDETIKRVGI